MTRGDRWLAALFGGALLIGCVTDHEALEKKPTIGAAAGGALGSAGSATQLGGSGGQGADGGGHADDEPPGTSVLTIVNGLVDAPSVTLCFAKVDGQGGVMPFGSPLGTLPLPYGGNLVLSTVPGAQLASDTLQPFVIAGDLDLIAGLDCEASVSRAQDEEAAAIDANTRAQNAAATGAAGDGGAAGSTGSVPVEVRSRLRLRGLPALPSGTLSAGRSVLYVTTGCLGGATFSAANAAEYCGQGYSEAKPTASAVLVSLSRKTSVGFTGLQFVHASQATGAADLSSRPPLTSHDAILAIASNVSLGQVAPRPALLSNAASAYGSTQMYDLGVSVQGTPLVNFAWVGALQSGGVRKLTDGVTYALVLIGPRVDHQQPTALWNASTITLIPVDP